MEGLANTAVHGVRRRSNGSVLVQAQSEAQAQLLLRHADGWVEHFAADASIERKSYVVSAAAVPTTFDPRAPAAREAIYLSNQGTIPSPDSILSVRWLHEHRLLTAAKADATLVIALSDPSVADTLIYRSLSICGALCPVRKFSPPPLQCFRCQEFGHVAKACPHLLEPSSLKCARCAGNHPTRECLCPAKTKCSNIRHCTHIKAHCANCGGPHKSVAGCCPVKAAAQATSFERSSNGSAYFNPTFHPKPAPARPNKAGVRT